MENNKKLTASDYTFIIVILLGSFLSSLTETIMNNALPTIMRAFNISQSTAQWLTTGYILVVGIMMPATAYFMDRFKLKPLFVFTLTLFLSGTVIAGFAPNFSILLLGRMVQAISVGISMPLTVNVLMLIFQVEKRGFAMGISGVVVILGPALGPTIAGWILNHYSWRALFHVITPLAVIIIILAVFFVKNVTKTKPIKLDWPSLLLSSIGLGSLLYGFSEFGDTFAYLMILVGLIAIIWFIQHQLHLTEPFLEIRVFKSKSFSKTALLAALSNVAMLGAELLLPLYIQNVHGASALTTGLLLMPGAIATMAIAPISGKLFDKYGIKLMAIVGFAVTVITTIPMIFFNESTSYLLIGICYTLRMAGLSMVSMQVLTSGINALPTELLVHGNTVASTVRQVASSLGTALIVTISSFGTQLSNQSGKLGLTIGYHWGFIAATGISVICLVISFTLKNKTTAEFEMTDLS
ncbi:MDR family MFS transporter [Loigolactobacillus zhaoyuanensis]|uniref:MDR family MFS transporter n=1 Tax=Loigolactobacillus zhaoyuanensis TaxID=2486017 RepID=UPI0013DDCF65|nr:MDR family MFS transporter [Loigolactobacillus zhaoyuanensis]